MPRSFKVKYSKANYTLIVLTIIILTLLSTIKYTAALETSRKGEANRKAIYTEIVGAVNIGDNHLAIQIHRQKGQAYLQTSSDRDKAGYFLTLSEAYINSGQYSAARDSLTRALQYSRDSGDKSLEAMMLFKTGSLFVFMDNLDKAKGTFEEALSISEAQADKRLSALILNEKGSLLLLRNDAKGAIEYYEDALKKISETGELLLKAKININIAKARLSLKEQVESIRYLDAASKQLKGIPDSTEKAAITINIGLGYYKLYTSSDKKDMQSLEKSAAAFRDASTIAQAIGHKRLATYALGNLGISEHTLGMNRDALMHTRQAYFIAQEAMYPEHLYLWQWRLGILKEAEGNTEEALMLYRQAAATLQGIRQELGGSCKLYNGVSHNEHIAPVYVSLVDMLIKKSETTEGNTSEALIFEAVKTLEMLKTAELQDYFRNACLQAQGSIKSINDIRIKGTALLYYVYLPDRLEIIVSTETGLKRYSIKGKTKDVDKDIESFRKALEKRTTHQYLSYSKRLYDNLIRPIEAELKGINGNNRQGIDTIIIVPDGALRTIPFSALQDGKEFLAEKYATVVVPGLTLTSLKDEASAGNRVLIAGISQSVGEFPSLPFVEREINEIARDYPQQSLINSRFTIPNVSSELTQNPYNIMHIASHGEFYEDSQETYILTWDRKMNIDDLETLIKGARSKRQPLQLLTLSACQSAADSDRAALGLGGIAVKSGARTALASLWYINDISTSMLISSFYSLMQRQGLSKAEALRQSQLMLLKDYRYRHPGYWSPFLIIGNWR